MSVATDATGPMTPDTPRLSDLRLHDHASPSGLARWIALLGITDAPTPRENVRFSLAFFERTMRGLPVGDAMGFLKAMDLSKPVSLYPIRIGAKLIAFRFPHEAEFKLFYTLSGGSPYESGILPDGRQCVQFRARENGEALHSYTTGALDHWSRYDALPPGSAWHRQKLVSPQLGKIGFLVCGGGPQLLIPRAWSMLDVLAPGTR